MVKKEFTNPINNETVELDECKLSKSIEDYEGRAERIPNVDKNYVDLGIQFKLAQLINSKNVSFKKLVSSTPLKDYCKLKNPNYIVNQNY